MNPKLIKRQVYRLSLSPAVRLRQERFGGLVFDQRDGQTLEVDKEGFEFLIGIHASGCLDLSSPDSSGEKSEACRKRFTRKKKFISQLLELGVLAPAGHPLKNNPFEPHPIHARSHSSQCLSAPETVHWAVTYRCGMRCPDCYAARFVDDYPELSHIDSLTLIDKIAEWNVFQLALGGGEPLERADIVELVQHARDNGLAVHLTTGRWRIDANLLEGLANSLTTLQFGIHSDFFDSPDWSSYLNGLLDIRSKAIELGIAVGANLYLDNHTLNHFNALTSDLIDVGLDKFTLIRYKPPANVKRWRAHAPEPERLIQLEKLVRDVKMRRPEIDFRLDCALSFLQAHIPERELAWRGVKGCVAADRIAALAPDGSVFPCSQLVGSNFVAGNMLEQDAATIWSESKRMRKYRFFRNKKEFKASMCGICAFKTRCGGCRAFADDALGGDPGCPSPKPRPLKTLGKTGRTVDFRNYMQSRYDVSIGEYMERYGIGQKTAIKELRRSPLVHFESGTGRRKSDVYRVRFDDPVGDVQASIGCTSAGFPYATYDEVAEWMGMNDRDYPQWIGRAAERKGHEMNEPLKGDYCDEDYLD